MRLCTLFILCKADKWYTLCDVIYNVVPSVYQLLWYVFSPSANLQQKSDSKKIKSVTKTRRDKSYLNS